jgi:hypothetical protein
MGAVCRRRRGGRRALARICVVLRQSHRRCVEEPSSNESASHNGRVRPGMMCAGVSRGVPAPLGIGKSGARWSLRSAPAKVLQGARIARIEGAGPSKKLVALHPLRSAWGQFPPCQERPSGRNRTRGRLAKRWPGQETLLSSPPALRRPTGHETMFSDAQFLSSSPPALRPTHWT